MLKVLGMFGPDCLTLNVETIADSLELSRATAYRYVKELCDSGLLTKFGGNYTLGPRIIELDRLMREFDPLISKGRDTMSQLSEKTGLTVMFSVFYNDRIINTHIETVDQSSSLSFGRGRPLPLFRGAQSKVLVSFQKSRKLKKIYEEILSPSEDYNFSWKEFSQMTRKVRQDGYCITHDELNLGLTGIAAPIIKEETGEVFGSLAVVGTTASFELFSKDAIADSLVAAASALSCFIEEE